MRSLDKELRLDMKRQKSEGMQSITGIRCLTADSLMTSGQVQYK